MITIFAARLLCVLAVLAPVVLALQPTQAAAQAQLAPVQRTPSYERQQQKINAWTVGLAAGLIEGAPSRPAVKRWIMDKDTNIGRRPGGGARIAEDRMFVKYRAADPGKRRCGVKGEIELAKKLLDREPRIVLMFGVQVCHGEIRGGSHSRRRAG